MLASWRLMASRRGGASGGATRGAPAERAGQRRERFALLDGELVWNVVQCAQRSDGEAVVGDEGRAGVEAQADRGDERPVREARVRGEVRDHERLVLEDRVRAEGDLARAIGRRIAAGLRLEPHALGVDQAHHGHRRPADLRGETDDVVVSALALGVEDAVAVQRLEALELVGWLGGDQHGRCAERARARAVTGRMVGSVDPRLESDCRLVG